MLCSEDVPKSGLDSLSARMPTPNGVLALRGQNPFLSDSLETILKRLAAILKLLELILKGLEPIFQVLAGGAAHEVTIWVLPYQENSYTPPYSERPARAASSSEPAAVLLAAGGLLCHHANLSSRPTRTCARPK